MLDTEQANAKIKQLEDEIEKITILHGEERQKQDEESKKLIDSMKETIEELRQYIETLQTELNQLKNP